MSMTTMHALRIHERGASDAIVYEEATVPQPGIGDVLVQVEASSFTPTELGWPSTWVDRRGLDRTPVIPGHEMSGVVVGIGYGTSGLREGDAVFGCTDWYRDGSAAEYVAVEARNLAHKPSGCSFADAAAIALGALTAWQALFDHGRLIGGERVLLTGATGGVGVFVLQLAKSVGATVFAAGRDDSAGFVAELGADEFVDTEHEGWTDGVKDIDLAIDLVGGELLTQLLGTRPERVVSIVEGRAGVDLFVVEPNRETSTELARRVDAGTLRPVIDRVTPLADGAAEFAPRRRARGKRVLSIRP